MKNKYYHKYSRLITLNSPLWDARRNPSLLVSSLGVFYNAWKRERGGYPI